MELKDMILSTLAEFDNGELKKKIVVDEEKPVENRQEPVQIYLDQNESKLPQNEEQPLSDEKIFLENIKERVLVLFEGLQSPKNENLETKLDITLNFLEFLLASIEKRSDQIK